MKTIFENDIVKISETGRNYDFIAVVENKLDEEIQVIFDDEDLEPETLTIDGNDWCGILANNNGYFAVDKLRNGRFLAEATN